MNDATQMTEAAWQDIATAPRDGTVILTNEGTARYDEASYGGSHWFLCDASGSIPSCADWGWEDAALNPTRWQPFPPVQS